MKTRIVLAAVAGLMAYSSVLWAQPIIDTGIYANNNAPTTRGELTVVREQSFSTTPPVMTGSGATLNAADPTMDGLYSQSLFFRSGPVTNNTRNPETEGEIRFPAGVTIIAILIGANELDATDTTWGLWDGTGTNPYTASARQMEPQGNTEYARIVTDGATGERYIEFRTEMSASPFTDEFRVLVDYGDGFPPNLELTVNLTVGDDVNVGANDGGLTNPMTAQVPLTQPCAGCYIDGDGCILTGALDATNDCMFCDPSVSDVMYSPISTGTVCDDGLFCTETDTCDGAGFCDGTARVCPEDTNDCTTAACDETADACGFDSDPIGSLCTGGVCDGNDVCVQCLTDLECSNGEICDLTIFSCTECVDNRNNGIDDGCSANTPACVGTQPNRTCVECAADRDCPGGVCSATNTCVECNVDTDCNGNQICDTSTNTCEVCADSQMSVDPGCDTTTPACIDNNGTRSCVACTQDADCPNGVCDVATNMCVACQDNGGNPDAGCTVATPVCDDAGAAPVCVECEVDGDCASGVCLPDNTCAACQTDADCAGTSVCDVSNNVCVACVDTGAGVDSGCSSATPSCVGTAGNEMCVECASDVDCAAGVCDVSTFTCVACTDSETLAGQDAGCDVGAPICDTSGTDPLCVACLDDMTGADTDTGCGGAATLCDTSGTAAVCVACQQDATVDPAPGCSDTLPVCRVDVDPALCVECGQDADCPADALCSPSGTCSTACVDATSCRDPNLPVCDATSGSCVGCLVDNDCSNGVCSSLMTCVACNVDADCAAGVCSANLCVDCVDNADCADGEICQADNTCAPQCVTDDDCSAPTPFCAEATCVECTMNEDCGDGMECVDNACVVTGCMDNADCPAAMPICDAGTCIEGCLEDIDCGAQETCEANVCVPITPEAGCIDDNDCDTGEVCDNGECISTGVGGTNGNTAGGNAEYELTGGCSTAGNSPSDALLALIGVAFVAIRRRR